MGTVTDTVLFFMVEGPFDGETRMLPKDVSHLQVTRMTQEGHLTLSGLYLPAVRMPSGDRAMLWLADED
jgi:hypothetical protein